MHGHWTVYVDTSEDLRLECRLTSFETDRMATVAKKVERLPANYSHKLVFKENRQR